MANENPSSWSELVTSIYQKLTEKNAELTYEFENMEIYVPSGVGDDASHARWKVNGVLKIRAKNLT